MGFQTVRFFTPLLLVLVLTPRVFLRASSGFSGFPPSAKINTAKFQFDREQWTKSHPVEVPFIYLFLFIYITLVKINVTEVKP